ncbi:MAG TPA: hypothetical protein VI698_02635 [Nitrososphaerales archaeon]|nr:hypothetical protein [Nitrososphaerales archaeon]
MRPLNYAVIGISLLAVVLITIFAVQQLESESVRNIKSMASDQIELGDYGPTVALEDAEKMLGYRIKLPTYLPAGNELRMIKVERQHLHSFVFYSPVSVDDSTKESELIANNGFLIVSRPAWEVGESSDIDIEIQRLTESGGREITLRWAKGVGFEDVRVIGYEDVPLVPGYSTIHWWDDYFLYRVVGGSFELDELAKIVESTYDTTNT